MKNIAYSLLCWPNDKVYYSQSYGKIHKMPEIIILVDSCGFHNNNNLIIRFLNMIKEGGFLGTDTLHFYIKNHTNNYRDRAFNIIKLLYQKQNISTFD